MNYVLKIRALVPELHLGDPGGTAEGLMPLLETAAQAGCHILVLPQDLWGVLAAGSIAQQRLFAESCQTAEQDLHHWSARHPELLILRGCAAGYRAYRRGQAQELPTGSRLDYLDEEAHSWALYLSDGNPCREIEEEQLAGLDLIVELPPALQSSEQFLLGRKLRQERVLKRPGLAYLSCQPGLGHSTMDAVAMGSIEVYDGQEWSYSPILDWDLHQMDLELSLKQLPEEPPQERLDSPLQETGAPACDKELSQGGSCRALEFGALEPDTVERPALLPFYVSDEELELQRRMQAYGLAARLRYIGQPKLVLGLSGGLDSTLALLVAADAMELLGRPASEVHALLLPGLGTSSRTYENSLVLARRLGVSYREISIKAAVLQHFQDIGQDPERQDVTYENSQARERTQILMDYANRVGGLVLGTGDLSELALGWCTYNGDHMAMYGVNGSLSKTLIRLHVLAAAERCLASEDEGQRELGQALQDVVGTPVSPELLPPDAQGQIAQKTEDSLGPYVLTDFFLHHTLRDRLCPSELLQHSLDSFTEQAITKLDQRQRFVAGEELRPYSRQEILRYMRVFYRRFIQQQFKRSCLPDGVAVTSYSLSPRVPDPRSQFLADSMELASAQRGAYSAHCSFPSDLSWELWRRELDRLEAED